MQQLSPNRNVTWILHDTFASKQGSCFRKTKIGLDILLLLLLLLLISFFIKTSWCGFHYIMNLCYTSLGFWQ